MSWIMAFLIIAAVAAVGVGSAVMHPVLYGLFIAAVLMIPAALVSGVVNGVIESLLGKRKRCHEWA